MEYIAAILIVGILVVVAADLLSKRYAKAAIQKVHEFSNMVENLSMKPTREGNYPWLDLNRLHKWTHELDTLEFTELGDYAIGTGGLGVEGCGLPESFTRVMLNDKLLCFAEISQSLHRKTGPGDMTCTIITFFDTGQQCRTSNGKAIPEAGIMLSDMLQQMDITAFQSPEAAVTELIKLHLEQRDKLTQEQELQIREDTSIEMYKRETIKISQHMLDWLQDQIADIGGRV